MKSENFKQLENDLCDIEAVINVVCDSCELKMYTTQFDALRIARKKFRDVFELLSRWEV